MNLPPNSRTTVAVATPSRTFGLLVESAGPTPVDLVVESAVYQHQFLTLFAAGANALATPLP